MGTLCSQCVSLEQAPATRNAQLETGGLLTERESEENVRGKVPKDWQAII